MASINPIQTPASSKLALATKSHQQNQQPATVQPAAEFKTHSGLHTFRRAWQQQKKTVLIASSHQAAAPAPQERILSLNPEIGLCSTVLPQCGHHRTPVSLAAGGFRDSL